MIPRDCKRLAEVDFPIAVVEAKADYKTPAAALGQAKEYAKILDLKFAYGTNGTGIVEFDFTTGIETWEFHSVRDVWYPVSATHTCEEYTVTEERGSGTTSRQLSSHPAPLPPNGGR